MRLVNTIEILEARKPSIFWNVQFWDSGQNGVNMKKKCDFEFFLKKVAWFTAARIKLRFLNKELLRRRIFVFLRLDDGALLLRLIFHATLRRNLLRPALK